MKKNTRIIMATSLFLIITVGCTLAVSVVALLDDHDDDEYIRPEEPKTIGEILGEIRKLMRDCEIQAYIITSVDAHQSEYISKHDSRLTFVSGFTGSNGIGIISQGRAAIWTDSRYYLQAEMQIDTEFWTLMKEGEPETPNQEDWLKSILLPNSRVGTDPFLMSSSIYERLSNKLEANGHKLVSTKRNLVDIVWKDQPEINFNRIYPLDIKYTGQIVEKKINIIREEIIKHGAESIVITDLYEIAWLLNLRGSDIQSNPVFYSYIILTQNEIFLYINNTQISNEILQHFENEQVEVNINEYDDVLNGINDLILNSTSKILISTMASAVIYSTIPKNRLIQVYSPTALLKCVKNDVEAEGMRKAHIRDGIALISYLFWLETNVDCGNITEVSGAAKLEEFRSLQENYKGVSFTTISAFGSNSAIVHYSSSSDTDKLITRDEIYLVDSGGQYLDGTTDITRTIHLGIPTDFQKECFTRVLKGFISVGSAIFPTKAPGSAFDALARKSLWDVGLDYGHGSGHGVGHFLSVHEYPPSFSTGSQNSIPGALENMFTSNEPGYYEDGEFGIRIEDVIQIVKANDVLHNFSGKGALTFYDITLAPIQTKLIDTNLLTKEEVSYLNNYHYRVRDTLGVILKQHKLLDLYNWLIKETQPICSTKN